MLRCDFWLERGREDAVVYGRENHTSSRWFLCVFVGNGGMNSGGTLRWCVVGRWADVVE